MNLIKKVLAELKLLFTIGCTSSYITKRIKTVADDLDYNGHISINSVYVLQELKQRFEKLPLVQGKTGHYKVAQQLPICVFRKMLSMGLPLTTHVLTTDNGKIKTFAIANDNATIALIREEQAEELIYNNWMISA